MFYKSVLFTVSRLKYQHRIANTTTGMLGLWRVDDFQVQALHMIMAGFIVLFNELQFIEWLA